MESTLTGIITSSLSDLFPICVNLNENEDKYFQVEGVSVTLKPF